MGNQEIDLILHLYIHNLRTLESALHSAGGSINTQLDQPLSEVLRTLAKNSVKIDAKDVSIKVVNQ